MKKMMSMLSVSLVFIASCITAHAQSEAESPAPVTAETEELASAESEAASESSTGTVARGIFTSDVQNHEPVDQLSEATTDTSTVLFFTELKDFQGETVTHRWEYNGESMAEVKFQVGGPRWRVWSSKNMMPEWEGTWTVSVVNGNGDVVASETLAYSATSAEAAAAATPAEASTNASTTAVADNVAIEADAANTADQAE